MDLMRWKKYESKNGENALGAGFENTAAQERKIEKTPWKSFDFHGGGGKTHFAVFIFT